MTARQVGLGVARAVRTMEREAERAQRRRIAEEKARVRQAMLDASAEAAESYERFISFLTDAHRVPFKRRDWVSTAMATPPPDAARTPVNEQVAVGALARYRPGWFAEILGIAKRRRKKLAGLLAKAKVADDEAFDRNKAQVVARREEITFAKSILAKDRAAMTKALDSYGDFTGVAIEGFKILYVNGRVIAFVNGVEQDDLPTSSVTLLQSGKASTKPLPTSKIFELHRDAVCSAAIRVAVEVLEVLPLEIVEVVVQCDLLDRSTGHITPQPIFYALVAAQALSNVNLKLADPAPLAERLGAHFEWNKRDGFAAIDLALHEIPAITDQSEPLNNP